MSHESPSDHAGAGVGGQGKCIVFDVTVRSLWNEIILRGMMRLKGGFASREAMFLQSVDQWL